MDNQVAICSAAVLAELMAFNEKALEHGFHYNLTYSGESGCLTISKFYNGDGKKYKLREVRSFAAYGEPRILEEFIRSEEAEL